MHPLAFLHEPSYERRLLSLAQGLRTHPENKAHADKTWVLRRLREWTRLYLEARHASSQVASDLPAPFREDITDPFVEACRALETADIPYLVVGSFGIALSARERGLLVITEDFDILLRPAGPELARPVSLLRELEFDISAGSDPLVDEDPVVLAGILRAGSPVRANRHGWVLDLLTQAAALEFDDCWARQRTVVIQDIEVRVAPLEDLIASKRAADRPKDRMLLETWREQLEGPLDPPDG